jgi:predicted Rossmann fold nucleotide-binding protein DprA/Smf involved in DNA uptake
MNATPGRKVREIREVVREEPLMHRPILQALVAGPRTIPEIAAEIGRPAEEVLVWVMGMRRYGKVAELPDPTDDGYFRYAAKDVEVQA